MARRVHAEGQHERQNMRDAARHDSRTGDWMVIAELPDGREVVAVGNLSSETRAEEAAENLRESDTAGYTNSDLRVAEKN